MEPGCEKKKLRDQRLRGRGIGRAFHLQGKGEVEVQRAHALSWNPDAGLDLGLSLAWPRGGRWLREKEPISPASSGL